MTHIDAHEHRSALDTVEGVVLDMDGVLWRGTETLPGVREFFAALATRDVPFVLATNNSGTGAAAYAERLRRHGIENVNENQVITSGTVTAEYLRSTYAQGARVHVLGSTALEDAIASAGFDVHRNVAAADVQHARPMDAAAAHGNATVVQLPKAGSPDAAVEVVVVGIDLELSYAKLALAAGLILAGAEFIGTNGDATLPTEKGFAPGTGSILAALRTATGRDPRLIGKPGPLMYASAARTLATRPETTLMIGDRIDTDIVGARRFGMQTALVLTGVTTAEEAQSGAVPTGPTYRDLLELRDAWFGTRQPAC